MEDAVVLLEARRFREALQQFAAALHDQPLATEPRIGLARSCLGLGDGWAAAAWLSDACRVAPHRAEPWLELAQLLLTQQREPELEPLLQAALAIHGESVPLRVAQAELYLRRKDYAKALPGYQRLYALQPADRATLLHFGYCLEHTGALEQAAGKYREAIAADPEFLEAHVDLAGVLWRLEDFEGALAHARRSAELAPDHPHAVRILGTALLTLNRVDEAEVQLRRALALRPGFELAEIDLAFALLLAGRMEEGWALYARRWRDGARMRRPGFFQPGLEWQGPERQPPAGKRIAVYAEQGLGDVIQFIRYAPMLQERGAAVRCVVQPELAALLECSMEGVQCLTGDRRFEVDWHVALLDLPMHFATTLANVPAGAPYLRAPAPKAAQWQERLAPWRDKLKVGLAWAGSPSQVNNNNRSLRLSDLMPLVEMEGVQCFSLQKAPAGAFTDVTPAPRRLVDLTGDWNDFTDSAAMVDSLDLVVSVDTAVAHLAGAMGKPVWVMLPPNGDWRWLLEREDSPWYPTMRLFRRSFGEARGAQVARVAAALKEHLAAKGTPQ